MASVENVSAVKFDCQVATVTMREDRELTKDVAEKALKDAGFGVKSFENGAGVTVSMLRMKAKGFQPDRREALTGAVLSNVKDVDFLAVSDDGEMILVMRTGASTDTATIDAALDPIELEVTDLKSSSISVGFQRYEVELEAARDGDRIRNAVAAVDGVLAVTVTAAERKLEVVTPEPCSNLEKKLAAALASLDTRIARLKAL